MAAYLAAEGVTVVPARPRGRPSTAELLAGAQRAQAHDIVFLPSDKDTMPVAEAAASAARDLGLRASVVPTRSIVQSLAAIAVHDPQARFDDAVIAMGRAAGATRYGAVTTAAREAVTNAGTCRPGDVLGLLDGDIVEIGHELASVAQAVVDRLVSGSTELLTVITGDDIPDGLAEAVCDHAMAGRRFLEIEVLDGGQPHWPLIFGAE
jgi:dihydroxyacetone kinase-like predicted kinase